MLATLNADTAEHEHRTATRPTDFASVFPPLPTQPAPPARHETRPRTPKKEASAANTVGYSPLTNIQKPGFMQDVSVLLFPWLTLIGVVNLST
jgi:hypothetical protein